MKIVVSSGKGGTGKTFVATHLAHLLAEERKDVTYLDCDVEAPNGHLFLKLQAEIKKDISITSPVKIDNEKCTLCGKCATACHYNALTRIKDSMLFFQNRCHVCGACTIACKEEAIIEGTRSIGTLISGKSSNLACHYGLLTTGEGGMTPRVIREVKAQATSGIVILDSPPGTSCPVVETVKDADICVLVTDPTPFGIHDFSLAVEMCRSLGKEPVLVINRSIAEMDELNDYCEKENILVIGDIPDARDIAECYAEGKLVFENLPHYKSMFQEIASRILSLTPRDLIPPVNLREELPTYASETSTIPATISHSSACEITVISGKGGTGKTSLSAAFAALEKNAGICDCDVDASDLHLVLNPVIEERGDFSGGKIAVIDEEKCTHCGNCRETCRFDAVEFHPEGETYKINPVSCEGCGACTLTCPHDAISLLNAINGEWFLSTTDYGPMSHARLGIAEENSGKLVTFIRNAISPKLSGAPGMPVIIDGSPGTGCPVISSLTGTMYAVIVTEPTVSGIHDLQRILELIDFLSIPVGVIINKYDINIENSNTIRKIAYDKNAHFLGEIPYDISFTKAQRAKKPITDFDDNPVTTEIARIWNTIKSNLQELISCTHL